MKHGASLFVFAALTAVAAAAQDAASLERDFRDPPATARPRVWWHWMNGNITKEGIRLDLEWMKRVGIGGLQNFDAALATPKVVEKRLPYMTPEWKDAFRYAATLADRLGLEMAIASSPGWSETGGPWVKPSQAMKKLVWSETPVEGGKKFTGTIPKPPAVTGPFQAVPFHDMFAPATASHPEYYGEAAVIAYRLPAIAGGADQPSAITSSAGTVDLAKGATLPLGAGGAWIQYEYAAPHTVYAVSIARPVSGMFEPAPPFQCRLEASDDGHTFRAVADLPPSKVAQHTVSFAPVTARYFRLALQAEEPAGLPDMFNAAPGVESLPFPTAPHGAPTAGIRDLVLYGVPRVNRFEEKAVFGLVPDYYAIATPHIDAKVAVKPADVIDLTARMRPDGSLDWTPPEGRWIVLRLGYSLTGTLNHPATAEATGLEVDKLDARAVKEYIETYLGTYKETLGPDLMGRHGVKALLTDSIEVGPYNWTPDLPEQFRRLRGYNLMPYLPALTGVVIGSAEKSDQFLWDFRRTLAELTAQSHYGQIAKSAREHGLTYYGESLEGTRVSIGDDMEMRQNADIPMSAMWTYTPEHGPSPNYLADIRGAASVAHIYGQNLVAAESMTSAMVPWGFSPRILKPIIDLEFALGVNRPVIHTSVHQPLIDKKPGLTLMIFGQYFNRNETWAEQAGPWVSYISRNAHMLQQGRFVADVAYFYGEEAPLSGLYGEGQAPPKDLPAGYGFDFVNSDVLLNRLSVANRELVTKSGMRYRVLYLGGSSAKMTLPVLRKLRDLIAGGAIVVGERPTGSPSLADDPVEFDRIAGALWATGKIIPGHDVNAALASLEVPRDFEYSRPHPDTEIMFLHRHLLDGEIYFLSNRHAHQEVVDATFRVAGKRPELWHAEDGRIEAVSYRVENGRTTIPLALEPHDSLLVVFRGTAAQESRTVAPRRETPLATLGGTWNLAFPDAGAVTLANLASWTEQANPEMKYFSGTATYTKSFQAPGGKHLVLDLGEVRELAEVTLNGHALGIVWHPPYKVDITSALRPGENRLEIKVTNLWVNRLIGDKQPGAAKHTFTVSPTYKADAPLRPSGLLGPVTVREVSN